jgi:hypothetical protein
MSMDSIEPDEDGEINPDGHWRPHDYLCGTYSYSEEIAHDGGTVIDPENPPDDEWWSSRDNGGVWINIKPEMIERAKERIRRQPFFNRSVEH